MKETADKPRSSAPVRLVNVLFWQLAGTIIGGLIPFPIFGLITRSSEQVNMWAWVFLAVPTAIVTAVIGGIVGTLIGINDRTPPFGPGRNNLQGGATHSP